MDEASLHIDAAPDALYDIVSDLPGMGRLSPENTGATWIKGATGPAVGARFRGGNKHGVMRWWTHGVITKADRPKQIEWDVKESGTRWGYRFEPAGDGTLV
nr:SRPBCC family protein [Actinomycetota bacterium]